MPMAEALAVMVTVTGTDALGTAVTLTTRGELTDLADGWTVAYDEMDPNNLVSVRSIVECRGNTVIVHRGGTIVSTMIYCAQETFVGEYATEVATFTLRVFTTEVSVRRRGMMGHIRLAYQLSLSTDLTVSDQMEMRWLDIRFRPCK